MEAAALVEGEERMSATRTITAGQNIFVDLNILDAGNEKLRLVLVASIRGWIKKYCMMQQEAAYTIGVKQYDLNIPINGRFLKFTIDRLIGALVTVWLHVNITVTI